MWSVYSKGYGGQNGVKQCSSRKDGLTLAMCAHTPRCAIIASIFCGLWLLDYIYGYLFKTYRLDLVEFSALPDEAGVQILWANPKGFNGEYEKPSLLSLLRF